jgi:serine/threonine protein phosphatase PrpC
VKYRYWIDDENGTVASACDGIWNFMSSQEVVDYINERINNTPDDKLSSICEEVNCLNLNSECGNFPDLGAPFFKGTVSRKF